MCQTKPALVKEVKGDKAVLEDGREVDVKLMPDVKPGDWILAYANVAIHKISKEEAKDILELYDDTIK